MNVCPAVERLRAWAKVSDETLISQGYVSVIPEMDADNARLEITESGAAALIDIAKGDIAERLLTAMSAMSSRPAEEEE